MDWSCCVIPLMVRSHSRRSLRKLGCERASRTMRPSASSAASSFETPAERAPQSLTDKADKAVLITPNGIFPVILRCERSEPRRMNGP